MRVKCIEIFICSFQCFIKKKFKKGLVRQKRQFYFIYSEDNIFIFSSAVAMVFRMLQIIEARIAHNFQLQKKEIMDF